MWSSAPKPDVAVTVNEKSPLQTSAARDERNPFSQQWSQNVKLLGDYCRNALTGDVIAGITVASVLVPQSMAYALLAGLSAGALGGAVGRREANCAHPIGESILL